MFRTDQVRPGRVLVKICGITRLDDAMAAIECGADALGFNFSPRSKRQLDRHRDFDWLDSVPDVITRVAVLTNPTWPELVETAELPFIDAVQLHGEETPAFCQQAARNSIRFGKALAVSKDDEAFAVSDFFTDTVLLDTRAGERFGGTGETFDWTIAGRIVNENPGLKIVVAGGLTPDNVADAIRAIRPFAVDVSSGVEGALGRKDLALLKRFLAAVQAA
jgi:phosphoribosylanthranilate isomerase